MRTLRPNGPVNPKNLFSHHPLNLHASGMSAPHFEIDNILPPDVKYK